MPGIVGAPQPQPVATAPADQFVEGLAQATGLDKNVVKAWVQIEGADAPGGTGGFNFLNLRAPGATGYSGVPIPSRSRNGFAQFASVGDAITESAYWINHMPNYSGIRQATPLGPRSQIAAIAASPWDAGHYNGGRSLYDAYAAVTKKGSSWLSGALSGLGHAAIDAGTGNPIGAAGDVLGGFGGKGIPVVGGLISAAEAPGKIAEGVVSVVGFAFNPNNWLRIGFIIGGGVLVLGGTVLLAKSVGALNVEGGGAATLMLPEAKALDLRSSGEKAYASRSYSRSREGISKKDSQGKGFSLDLPNQGRRRKPRSSASSSSSGDAIPF